MNATEFVLDYIERHKLFFEGLVGTHADYLTSCRRLERAKRVSHWRHSSGLRYWTRRASKPMTESSLASNVAFAMYCNSWEPRKIRAIKLCELEKVLGARLKGIPGRNYLAQSQSMKLGHARVDVSNNSIGRIVTKTRRLLRSFSKQQVMSDVISQGFFEVTWIVASESKRSQLAVAFNNEDLGKVSVRLVTMPAIESIQPTDSIAPG